MKTNNYSFIIRFDDETHSLSAASGLPIDLIGDLLILLSKAVGLKKGENLTLSEIRGNCYAIGFTTSSEIVYSSMQVVHKRISENEFSGLNFDQKKYAAKLNCIVDDGYRINVYNPNKDFNYKIAKINIDKKIESYFEIEDVYGIVVSIGSASLDSRPSIKLSKEGYDIYVTSAQERKLINHFKKDRLLLTIKKKINFHTGKIESATLIDFEVSEKRNSRLIDNVENLSKKYKKRGLFTKINDSAISVRNLRGDFNLNNLNVDGQE